MDKKETASKPTETSSQSNCKGDEKIQSQNERIDRSLDYMFSERDYIEQIGYK
jgi:hypothetical protein